jgi:hypothetical protein
MTPGGTLKISPAEVIRFGSPRAPPLGADSTTAPLVQSASDIPPASAALQNTSGVIAIPFPTQSLRTALVVPAISIGLSILLVVILYVAIFRGSATATEPTQASTAMPQTTLTASVLPQGPAQSAARTPDTPLPEPPTPSTSAPIGTKLPAVKTEQPAKLAVPPEPARSPSFPAPKPQTTTTANPRVAGARNEGSAPEPSACMKLKFLARQQCHKAHGYKPRKL